MYSITMLYKIVDGKNVEIMRSQYKDDTAYYLAILKAKGFLNQTANK
jgi:hypothetical protein